MLELTSWLKFQEEKLSQGPPENFIQIVFSNLLSQIFLIYRDKKAKALGNKMIIQINSEYILTNFTKQNYSITFFKFFISIILGHNLIYL